ncbi:TPA: hypothetical protein DEP21_05495 [Patescibacteria group bacterium]|nr:hypothetical protein [Candidatus Gracilibacteria bacterium]
MNIHKLSEYKTYAHNHEHKPQINQALAENFSLNKNFKDKRSLISDPNANMKDLDKKKDKDGKCIYILDDEEENKKINILIIENLCRPLLLKTYKHFEQIKSTPKQKLLLQECYENAKEYMNIVDTTKDNINNQRLRNIAKVCRGETFLFSSNDKKIGYFFEIEKAAKQKEGIPQIKKGERFFRRHIDN